MAKRTYIYNGTTWEEISTAIQVPVASTTVAGTVQLTDSVSSTSTTTAATPASVKQAYDKANEAFTPLFMTGV